MIVGLDVFVFFSNKKLFGVMLERFEVMFWGVGDGIGQCSRKSFIIVYVDVVGCLSLRTPSKEASFLHHTTTQACRD